MITAQSLEEQVASKVNEVKSLVANVDGKLAARKPGPDEWCVNEVLSHLIGPELGSWKAGIEAIVKEDTPLIEVNPGISYYEERSQMSTEELLSAFESEYSELGRYLRTLTDEQLKRKGHVPLFKETPLGEYPTLAEWMGGILNFHVADHVSQLRRLCG